MEPVWFERRKWPDRPHYRWQMVPVGEDELGLWCRMLPDAPVYKGDEVVARTRRDGLRLVSWTEPWCAWFPSGSGSPHPPEETWELYVDVIDRAVLAPDGTVTMVDLDLDVVRFLDGRVEMLDEDEFAEHQALYGYPPEVTAAARSAADDLLRAVTDGDPPFDGAAALAWAETLGIELR